MAMFRSTATRTQTDSLAVSRYCVCTHPKCDRGSAQVRNALQALQTARQRIAAAEASARAAGEKLQSELRLFQTGESTNFLVLTRQNEYADARHRALAARLDYNKSVARSEQALGKTLEAHGVSLR